MMFNKSRKNRSDVAKATSQCLDLVTFKVFWQETCKCSNSAGRIMQKLHTGGLWMALVARLSSYMDKGYSILSPVVHSSAKKFMLFLICLKEKKMEQY